MPPPWGAGPWIYAVSYEHSFCINSWFKHDWLAEIQSCLNMGSSFSRSKEHIRKVTSSPQNKWTQLKRSHVIDQKQQSWSPSCRLLAIHKGASLGQQLKMLILEINPLLPKYWSVLLGYASGRTNEHSYSIYYTIEKTYGGLASYPASYLLLSL